MKTSTYNQYGESAKEAALLGGNPIESWQIVVNDIFDSESAKTKGCPKNTFLGLCEAGLVKGIPKGNYTNSKLNKEYGITAVTILKTTGIITKKELWQLVKKELLIEKKAHNSQMDVVIALWENGLIKK